MGFSRATEEVVFRQKTALGIGEEDDTFGEIARASIQGGSSHGRMELRRTHAPLKGGRRQSPCGIEVAGGCFAGEPFGNSFACIEVPIQVTLVELDPRITLEPPERLPEERAYNGQAYSDYEHQKDNTAKPEPQAKALPNSFDYHAGLPSP
jgi:hypothetical protein